MTNHWTDEWYDIVSKYYLQQFGWAPSKEEYSTYSIMQKRSLYLDALAHFKLQRHYRSLDEVPEEVKESEQFPLVNIRGDKKVTQYMWSKKRGEWVQGGEVNDDLYK